MSVKIVVKDGTFAFQDHTPEIIIPEELTAESPYLLKINKVYNELLAMHHEHLSKGDWIAAHQLKRTRLDTIRNFFRKGSTPGSKTYTSHWKPIAPRVQRVATGLVSCLNPRALVRWHIPTKGSDYTTFDEKEKRWIIFLDSRRLRYSDVTQTGQVDPNHQMIQSSIGAVLHELAHTLHSPPKMNRTTETYEQLVIYRVYEELYVDSMIRRRLPGAKPMQQAAVQWANPGVKIRAAINSLIQNQGLQSFEDYVTLQGTADVVALGGHDAKVLTLPDTETQRIHNEFRPYVEKLTAKVAISVENRWKMYQEMADIITKDHKPAVHDLIPDLEYSINDNGGTETPLNQKPLGHTETLGEGLARTDQSCMSNATADALSVPQQESGDESTLQAMNSQLDDIDSDNMGGLEGINYAKTNTNDPRRHTVKPDPSLVDKIRKIFRTRHSERRNYIHGMPEGKLSTRKLHKLLRPGTDRNVFKRRPRLDSVNTSVLFLVDASGSMQGAPYDTATLAAQTMYDALQYNADYKVHVWIYSGGGSHLEIINPVHKKEIFWPQLPGGGTPSYLALAKAYEFLNTNYPKSHKVIVHFTDAYPGWDGQDHPMFHALKKDKAANYCSVAVIPQHVLEELRKRQPQLRLMAENTDNLAGAIHEFIIEHAG